MRLATVVAAVVLAAVLAGCGKDAAPPPVAVEDVPQSPTTSLQDDRIYQFADLPAPERDRQVDERVTSMAELGAAVIRVDLRWDLVAPIRPADPADPDDPGYDWSRYDPIVAAAKRHGVEVLFTVWGTPAWAADLAVTPKPGQEYAVRPAHPEDFGAFAAAAASRYAPRGVHRWEAWNEPNIQFFLTPQYERRDGRWVAVSPATYSDLLKQFYDNVKRVAPDVDVAGAVMAPTGDDCDLSCSPRRVARPARIAPAAFLRGLDAEGLRPPMDVVSHHPYPTIRPKLASRPRPRAIDLYNLDRLTEAIDRTYLRGKPIWLTEYGFATEPTPSLATFVSPEEQATAISDALSRGRAVRRVRLMTYYFLQDNASWKSGLTTMDGTSKPGRDAFAMPLFAEPAGEITAGGRVRVVGQVRPAAGRTTVILEWRAGDAWKPLREVRTLADGTYAVELTPTVSITVRARWSGESRTGTAADWTSPDLAIPVRAGS